MGNQLPYNAYEVRPGVWAIDECSGRFYLITGSEKALLLDSGYGTGDDLRGFLKTLYDGPLMLTHTHAHADHTGGDHEFEEVYADPKEWPELKQNGVSETCLRPLSEGDVIDLGDRKIEVLETPGHTAGSLSFLDRENRILFSGDNVADVTVFLCMSGADVEKYRAVLTRFEEMYPAWEVLLGHHGKAVQDMAQLKKMEELTDAILAGQVTGTPFNPFGDYWFDKVELNGASIYLPQAK